jgi:ferric-dicitrate binding protein FerR (iron transport regulator)
MKEEKFLKLLSKKLSGKLSPSESEALNQAGKEKPVYRQIEAGLGEYRDSAAPDRRIQDRLQATWEMIKAAGEGNYTSPFDYSTPKGREVNVGYFLKIAAVLVLVAGLGFVTYRFLKPGGGKNFEILATGAQKSFRVLEDGTEVWLNKNSVIRYNEAFGTKKRELFLEGEAYFDVAHNPKVPMFVHAGGIDIEVKGTAFNVNAYKSNSEIQVALIRGKIQVTNREDTTDKILLKPHQQLIFTLNRPAHDRKTAFLVLPIPPTLLAQQSQWTSDTLVFQKTKLKDLALQLEKKYDLKIQIQSERLKEKRFSGTFTTETIQQVLAALKLTYPLTYKIDDRLVVISD